MKDYSKKYSESGFWSVLKKIGKSIAIEAMTLYYAMGDKDTPAWAKGVIFSALGYLVWPLDAVPDAIPLVGFSDDALALSAALATVELHIKAEHRERARNKFKELFGD